MNFKVQKLQNTFTDSEDYYPKFLTFDEIDAIIDSAKKSTHDRTFRDIAILELLRGTGCRRDTVLNLQWNNINFRQNELTLYHKKTKNKTVVKMNSRLINALTLLYNTSLNKTGNVFISQKGNPLSKDAYTKMIKKYSVDSGLQGIKDFTITGHTFRHSFITHLVKNGVSLYKVIKYIPKNQNLKSFMIV